MAKAGQKHSIKQSYLLFSKCFACIYATRQHLHQLVPAERHRPWHRWVERATGEKTSSTVRQGITPKASYAPPHLQRDCTAGGMSLVEGTWLKAVLFSQGLGFYCLATNKKQLKGEQNLSSYCSSAIPVVFSALWYLCNSPRETKRNCLRITFIGTSQCRTK